MAPVEPVSIQEVAGHLLSLLQSRTAPDLPENLADAPGMRALHDDLLCLRRILLEFSSGNFSGDISLRGFAGGTLKALQAAMRHLTWQVRQVAEGDFSQRVDFLGEFSTSFNTMVLQLEDSLNALKHKEAELTRLTETLRREATLRTATLKALASSEAKFKYLAGRDPLTDALNRRAFLEALQNELEAAADAKLPCSLALLDVDHFKNVNDRHGHQAGDEVLKEVARIAGEALRRADLLGRYGGEEFILFFAGAGLRAAFTACERIRQAIGNAHVLFEGKEIRVTVSLGVTELPAHTAGPRDAACLERIIAAADKALYKAKNSGRNRVMTQAHRCRTSPQL